MRIVFLETDTLGKDVDLSFFDQIGEVTRYSLSDPEKNAERIREADVIIVNKVPVNEELLRDAKNVRLVCVTGTGTNIVDFPYVNSRGITVTNVRSYSTMSVVQHTFALLFYVYEKLAYYDQYVKSGVYSGDRMFCHFENKFHELAGKTWGIIGLGEIGRKVAQAANVFGCEVIYYSTTGKNNNPNYERVDWEALLLRSDILSIHAPLTADTEKMMNREAFAKMKQEAILLNLGRGAIVDQRALAEALASGAIAGAGLDVLEKEPIEPDDELLKCQDSTKLIITPHMAWATCEARQRCVNEVYQNIVSWKEGNERNVVTQ